MRCECCGRETDILIEIGAVSPRVATTGKCCASCCSFILYARKDRLEEKPDRQAEWVSVSTEQVFVDEYDIGNLKSCLEAIIIFALRNEEAELLKGFII